MRCISVGILYGRSQGLRIGELIDAQEMGLDFDHWEMMDLVDLYRKQKKMFYDFVEEFSRMNIAANWILRTIDIEWVVPINETDHEKIGQIIQSLLSNGVLATS